MGSRFMKLANGILVQSFRLLPRRDRIRIFRVVLAQILVGIFDLVGVIGIGLLGTLTVTGISSTNPPLAAQSALRTLKLDGYNFQNQVAILASAIGVLLLARTLLSVILSRRILRFLSVKAAEISQGLFSRLINSNLVVIQSRSVAEYVHVLSSGVSKVAIGIVGTATTVISDVLLLAALGIGLFVINPTTAIIVSLTFFGVGYLLYFLMHTRALMLGENNSRLGLQIDELVTQSLDGFKEISAKGQRPYFADKFSSLSFERAKTSWEIAFMPNVGKYVIEGSIVIGTLLIAGFQFLMQDAINAIATLTIFLAAGTRIAPAVLRIQQGLIQIKESFGSAKPTLELVRDLESESELVEVNSTFDASHNGFNPSIRVDSLTYQHKGESRFKLQEVSFEVKPGEFVAVVGASGSGKTTLIDLILGLLIPDSGSIRISGLDPRHACSKWPGAIAYIPQSAAISKSSLGQEILLGYDSEDVPLELISNALEISQLMDLAPDMASLISLPIGIRGSRISGGQRQRLSIAKGLVSSPKILIFDEATSALDGMTEAAISEEIKQLRGKVTLLVIAHRLTTILDANKIIYLQDGEVIDIDNFENLKRKHVNFLQQAEILGL